MARPSGAHTHPPSGGVIALVLIAGAVVVAKLHGSGRAVASAGRAAVHVLDIVLIAAGVTAALAVAAGVTVLAVTRRRHRQPRQVERGWTATVDPAGRHADRPMRDLPAAPRSRPAMTALPPASSAPLQRMPPPAGPAEVHYHVHLPEGADPQAIADALRGPAGTP